MNVNKKLDRLKQWAGERMGGEVKTAASDDFKNLEMEMNLRHEGMEKLHGSMSVYVKSMSKRKEGDDKEKMLPVDVLAQAMIFHGEEFEADSLFGNCLMKMGHANEKIARVQDSYVATASETWLESLERSLAQMKEYQAARRKLESRRLAYDATLTKMQKQKREDFRIEEELRAQRIKYEESSEDVLRRMGDIQEGETESMTELGSFLEAELEYHDRCRDILMNLKRQWPHGPNARKPSRSRSSTAHSFNGGAREPSPPPPVPQTDRPSIRSRVNAGSLDTDDSDRHFTKPAFQRTNTTPARNFEGPIGSERMARTWSDQSTGVPNLPTRANLRPVNTDTYADTKSTSLHGSPDKYAYDERSTSPSRSVGSIGSRAPSRSPSSNALSNSYAAGANSARKQAPPPPPPPVSRGTIGGGAKKPPPPPPPVKRSQLSNYQT